jgi:L-2-hydroxyglutarate oxidase LhgO
MLRAGFDFRGIALSETRKRFRRTLVSQAGRLATNVRLSDYTHWGHPGIRAQLLDVRRRTLVMDFLVQGDERSLHVLNAVSPAFTCSIPFARHVVEIAERSQS